MVDAVGGDSLGVLELRPGGGGHSGDGEERDEDSLVLHFDGIVCVVRVECDESGRVYG